MELSRGPVIVVIGLLLFASTVAVSAATAPSKNVVGTTPTATPTDRPGDATTTAPTTGGASTTGTDGQTATDTKAPTSPTATPWPNRRQTIIGIHGGGPGWHEYGSVRWLDGSSLKWKEDSADSYFDVTRLDNGSIMVGFSTSGYEEGCEPYDAPCTKTGFRIIDPEPSPRVVSEYAFPVRSIKNSEVHDVERLGDSEFLVTDMDQERMFVVENGSEVWEWRASELYDAPPDPTKRDWLHINDIDVIGEDTFLVSVRNANQLVIVERGEGVVEIINEDRSDDNDDSCTRRNQLKDFDDDGDVRCGNPELLDHQHNPQWVGEGAVLVADSDNDRVVELHRSDDGDWEIAWKLESAGGIALSWPRDADRLRNGNTLVTDTLNRRVFEVTQSGEVVWSRGTDRIPYEADRLPEGEFAGTYPPARDTATATDSPTPSGTGTATARDSPTTRVTTTETDASYKITATGTGEPDDAGGTSDRIPGLSLALVGLRSVFPSIPFWFNELQLALSLVAFGLVVGGGVDTWRN